MTNVETLTLTDFLRARIAEDEVMAQRVLPYVEGSARIEVNLYRSETLPDGSKRGTSETVTPYDPARVLAECEAKRRIVELHGTNGPHGAYCVVCERDSWPCRTVALLALPYADHPDYRDEWRP